MDYIVRYQHLGMPDGEGLSKGDIASAERIGPGRIKDLVSRGFIEPLPARQKSLDEMKKSELLIVAAGLGVEVKGTRDDILAAIKDHQEREEAEQPEQPDQE